MQLIGRYRLDSVQGVGAFATVWRGHDPELEIEVAVKVLADNWAHRADIRERFLEEARFLRHIDDPNVVRVHDVGVDNDRPYFVMDFVSGGTVADLTGQLDPPEAVALAARCCRSVQSLHDHGVLHRDVKPSNLLISGDGSVLVSDLGSAKRLAEASGITVTTGTPAYMSPEQALGEPLDVRTDVYGLGVLTHELITGTLPFDDPLNRKQGDKIERTPAGRGVDHVIGRALDVKPDERPDTAEAFAQALENAGDRAPFAVPALFVLLLMTLGFSSAAITTYLLA